MRKNKVTLFFILSLTFFLYAMGSSNNLIVEKIPQPDREFQVKLSDVDGNIINVTSFSIDGITYLPVRLGKANLSLDFAKIKKILFYVQNNQIKVRVFFKDGSNTLFDLQKDLSFVGKTRFGNLKIKAKYVKEIDFRIK